MKEFFHLWPQIQLLYKYQLLEFGYMVLISNPRAENHKNLTDLNRMMTAI